jgi:hypothetical protein
VSSLVVALTVFRHGADRLGDDGEETFRLTLPFLVTTNDPVAFSAIPPA